jgi:hypothetical protein
MTTHHLGHVLETLRVLQDPAGRALPDAYLGILAKSLVVHSARIPDGSNELGSVLSASVTGQRMRAALARFFGYGVIDPAKLTEGALTRVTLIGAGELLPGNGHRYAVPLPPSLSGHAGLRTLAITVAALVPIRARDHRHRASEIYFRPDTESLAVSRLDADHHLVRKGSVQHEVLEGKQAAVFADGSEIAVTVSCRSLVGAHNDPSMYGIAVTLAVPEQVGLPIYTEVEARVRQQIAIRQRVQNPS